MLRLCTEGIQPARLSEYRDRVKRLTAFIAKQESDARGWIKDPDKLRVALEALREWKGIAIQLDACLAEIEALAPKQP